MIRITQSRIALAAVLALAGYMSSVAIRACAQCSPDCINTTLQTAAPPALRILVRLSLTLAAGRSFSAGRRPRDGPGPALAYSLVAQFLTTPPPRTGRSLAPICPWPSTRNGQLDQGRQFLNMRELQDLAWH